MGTCYYLQREGGELFDLDKAYGLSDYLRAGRHGEHGPSCDLGTDLDTLILVLAEHQPYPCGPDGVERRAFAQRLLDFAQGQSVRLFSEHDVPESDDEHGRAGYLDRVVAERFPPYPLKEDG